MKKLICTITLAAMLCGAAGAADAPYSAAARLRPDVPVRIGGIEQTFYDADGIEVHPLSYNDTTYVPIRAVGELMGKNVNWDEVHLTATIGGERTTVPTRGTPDTAATPQNITVRIRPDYTIVIDGVARTFRDVDGRVVDPLLYNGSIYLPLRAIGEMMGMNVEWDATDGTVFLSGEVTDYDTNYTISGEPVADTGIGIARAREIALQHAGRTAGEVVFVESELGRDDGRLEYEIEFIYRSGSTYIEYDYEIDASTGAILDTDRDAEHFHGSQTSAATSADRAKQIALAEVPGATAANIRDFDIDEDDGRLEYEVKILYSGVEYEFTIDASTGNITERETERDDDDWDDRYDDDDDRYDDDWDDRYDDDDDRYDDDWDDRYDDDDDRYDDDWDDRYDDDDDRYDDWDDRYDDDDWDDRYDDDWDDRYDDDDWDD